MSEIYVKPLNVQLNDMSLIIGSKYTEEIKELQELGYQVKIFDASSSLDEEISSHADMNCMRFCNKLFVNSDIIDRIGELEAYELIPVEGICSPYPGDIKLNCAVIGKYLLCNTRYTAKEILDYANHNEFQIIHTNQGYSNCSVCMLNNNAVITDDDGIACLLKKCQIDVLMVAKGSIRLSDNHYGFIGGASGKLNDKEIYFSGDLSSHPDYENIIRFLNKYNITPIYNKSRKLNDFGGFVSV